MINGKLTEFIDQSHLQRDGKIFVVLMGRIDRATRKDDDIAGIFKQDRSPIVFK